MSYTIAPAKKFQSAQPTFSRTAKGYNVLLRGERLGSIERNWQGVWVGTHRDGTPAPAAWSRIDAAWLMINS